ncbi:transmembrane protein [Heterostelium album PN500]|uniref:Transmembrane protein n=1 Tax=Heterostelium pallidum (strain ATCC 26659 / Pp 5 / PN500) TaxID=670386 RepID=D3AZA0_HETP5|nr:transmembrane protein [Heterostelium album PN500]EFA85483.1 transmembrane protein [Heterostelium album PN500]|eukprot:XP_020437591.1 transmembrane protein [Heterostelium album PN500]
MISSEQSNLQQQQQQQQQPWKKKKQSFKEKQRKSSFYLATWLFLKILSVVFFISFFSSYIQIKGLVGDDGILPLTSILESNVGTSSSSSVAEVNSIWLFFINTLGLSVNTLLHLICISGLIFSALSIFTISHSVYLGFMWFFYYCIVDVGQIFYAYQWDQLLLETAFLAIFISPFNSKYDEKPSQPIRYLLKWLLFRLMFGSGISKLTPIWSSLQAMCYHYETQCIPNAFFHTKHSQTETTGSRTGAKSIVSSETTGFRSVQYQLKESVGALCIYIGGNIVDLLDDALPTTPVGTGADPACA